MTRDERWHELFGEEYVRAWWAELVMLSFRSGGRRIRVRRAALDDAIDRLM